LGPAMVRAGHRPAVSHGTDDRCTVSEVAELFQISRDHLVKVVHGLQTLGYLTTRRGRGGGFDLARPAAQIGIGQVVRDTEGHFDLVECLGGVHCRLLPVCVLKGALQGALAAFFEKLDGYTLADMIRQPTRVRAALALPVV